MMRRILTAALLAAVLVVPVTVTAQGLTQAPAFEGTQGGSDLVGAITTIVNVLLTVAALIAAIYIVYGGVKYITSAGDDEKASEAKNTILYALIGLIVIGLSAVLANFVLRAVAGG